MIDFNQLVIWEKKMPQKHGPAVATIMEALRRELKGRGIRVSDLVTRLGVAEPTVRRWLRGQGLTLDRLDRLCAAVGVDMRDLVARDDAPRESFTLSQERVLAADRGLALTFFAILQGAQRDDLENDFGFPTERLMANLRRLERLGLIETTRSGMLRAKLRRSVAWRRGGPLAVAFERTVKPLLFSQNFGSPDALYVSNMVRLTPSGRARVQALFEGLRDDILLIAGQEQSARLDGRDWSGVLMMIRPFENAEMTAEWRDGGRAKETGDGRS
ncbi:helix-turn-helix domain-containing protein [Flavisphingomonas formosensis]|uniref:helix-turn-helix domain-containing protein n=1 Tax=Flavisphingomonas formosensis TaxID=861534 RepID=UPI0012F8D453|nr:helix-turn-helix transcriptional regulator [Sphingomonas formosensis]